MEMAELDVNAAYCHLRINGRPVALDLSYSAGASSALVSI